MSRHQRHPRLLAIILLVAAILSPLPVQAQHVGPSAAPTIPPPAHPLPPGTGFLVPNMDLTHLRGDRPAGVHAAALPSRFDWRAQGKVTPVKNQSTCGSCYAFAAIAGFESRLLIAGEGTFDLSENHVKGCNWEARNGYQHQGTPLGGCNGGFSEMVVNLFTQTGTVLESCDPYQAIDAPCKTNCQYGKTVLDWRMISGQAVADTNVLKHYLYTYGPIATSLYVGDAEAPGWEETFNDYDGSNTLYYAGQQTPNHAVLIVGWDDNLQHAGGQGAWIVKNSWGTDWGGTCGYGNQKGYFTIAYGSAQIGFMASFINGWQDYDSTGQLWLWDEAGWNSRVGMGDNRTCWALARFVPSSDTRVTRVEFWTVDATSDVDVYVYDGFDGNRLTNVLAQQENLSFPEAGYHSVLLPAPVQARAGNDLIAAIRVTNANVPHPIAADARGPVQQGVNWLSATGGNGTWLDTGAYNWNLGLRLRTSNVATGPTSTPTTGPTVSGPHKVRLPVILKQFFRPGPPTPTPTRTTVAPRTPTPTRTPVSSATCKITIQNDIDCELMLYLSGPREYEGAVPANSVGVFEVEPGAYDYTVYASCCGEVSGALVLSPGETCSWSFSCGDQATGLGTPVLH